MKLLIRIFYKLATWFQKIEYGETVTVYFPKEDMYEEVVVSSVRKEGDTFKGKFIDGKEPEWVDVWESYGQSDNDICFYVDSREVVDVKEKK